MKKASAVAVMVAAMMAACAAPDGEEASATGGAITGGDTANGTAQTVAIRFEGEGGASRGVCTGFLIGPQTVVTAAHCFLCGRPSRIQVFSPYPQGDGVAYAEWDSATEPKGPPGMANDRGELDYAPLSYLGTCNDDGIQRSTADVRRWPEAHLDIAAFKLRPATDIVRADGTRTTVAQPLGDAIGLTQAVAPPYVRVREVTDCSADSRYDVDGAMTNGHHPLRSPAREGQTLETSRSWHHAAPHTICNAEYGDGAEGSHLLLENRGVGIDKVAVETEQGDSGGMIYLASGDEEDVTRIERETAVALNSIYDPTQLRMGEQTFGPFIIGVKLWPHRAFLEGAYQAFEGAAVSLE